MNPTNLWNRAIERSIFNRSVARSAPPRSCPVWRGEPPEHSAAALGVRGSRIRRPVRSLRRHARAVALAVLGLAAALFAVPEPAEAQTVTTFVSNTGQAGNDTSYYVRATSFTTGGGTHTLTSVGVRVITAIYGSQVVSNYSPLVQIFENDNNQPGTLLETLTNPASITNRAVNTFTAPAGITLSANTVYWLVTSNSAQPNGIGFQVGTISATTADSGAAARWSIGGALSKLHITTSSWESSKRRTRFQIRATAITDATLRALALSNAADDSAIALSPPFAAGTTSYTVAVLSGMAEITLAPTPTIAGASVAYLDGSDTPIPDADTTKAGQQVSLAVDANTITVQVTAEDTTTTLPYTVTVTRAATRSPDATLRALALSNVADDSAIALSPSFAAGTTSYTAAVLNEVEQITIAPTPTNNGASVKYLNSSDTEIPDADTTKAGQQVPLAVDATTITVQVTAEDTTTPLPYTVTVTRTPASAQARVTEAEVIEAEVTEAVVTEVRVTSTPQLTSDTYGTGETIEFTVTFSDAVNVEDAPAFRFSLGNAGQTQGVARVAAYDADRSTATKLVFTYEVQASDEDTDGIRVGDHTQTFPPDANDHITSNNAAAILTHSPLGILTDHKVDGSGPPPPPPPPLPPPTGTVTDRPGTTTGGGTGGGGGSPSQDEHGNPPAQATLIALDPARTAATAGQLNTVADVDYFSVDVPHAGAVVVETTGSTATVGTVWQAGEELATAASGGAGRNFRLSVRVAPGPVVIAVAGNGQQTGAYTLQVTFLSGFLENPGAASFQSGIGLISGWVCDAEEVEIVLNGEPQEAAYGTARLDTAGVCGDADNGFGLLFNWNLLGDGEHEVVALVDGVELDRATVTVTTLGTEFLRDVTGTCTAADFPTMDETVTLAWQQTQQNFVIVDGAAPAGANRMGTPGVGYLENPGPNSFQSGIGVLSGWACEGEEVVIELNGQPQPAAYGTERLDTLEMCGDTDNGFGLLFNWNLLGEGEHEVVAFVDGEELGRATVRVTTLGAEFVRDVEGECTVEDFPMPGETVTLEWQQNSQNFVITDVE